MSAQSRPLGPGDQVFLVDGSSFVFRAYFQSMNQDRKYNVRPSDGLPTGAVRLFSTKLFQFIREGAVGMKPTHLAIIFDKSEHTFRNEIYADYKANRNEPPSELVPQFPLTREAAKAFGLIPIEQAGLEADDLIASYACRAAEAGAEVLIVSADKDLMQLVRPGVTFYDPESGLKGKPGYRPERRLGCDHAFCRTLVRARNLFRVIGATARKVLDNADQALLSKRLVTLECDANLEVPPADLALDGIDAKRLIAFFKALELNQLVKRVAEAYDVDASAIEPDPQLASKGDGRKWQAPDGLNEKTAAVDASATELSPPLRGRVGEG